MPSRVLNSFIFPLRKFDDSHALFSNFKYLEIYLQGLSGGGVEGFSRVGLDANGIDPWTPGIIEWGNGTKQVEDDLGLISSYSGTNDRYIHVATPGLYLIELSVQMNRSTDATAFSWIEWGVDITQATSGDIGIDKAQVTHIALTDADTNTNDFYEYVAGVFRIDDVTNRIYGQASSLRSAANSSTEFNAIFLEGYDSTPSTHNGTFMKFTKLGS